MPAKNDTVIKSEPPGTIVKRLGKEVNTFVRQPRIEKFFSAISASPVVKTAIVAGVLTHDRDYYLPNSIEYFYARGFYPFCYDTVHSKLSILVNRNFDFPLDIMPTSQDAVENDEDLDNLSFAFSASFLCYCPEFFSALPKAFADIANGKVDLIDFRIVDPLVFDEILPYAKDPSSIKQYEFNRRVSENREKGLITENVDSVAGEMLDILMQHAVLHKATDVHIEYDGAKYRARIRVDGDLQDYPVPLDPKFYSALISVIKIRCEIDVVEHFRPQDGMFQHDCAFAGDGESMSSSYDIRVSIIPQADGRLNAVLRIQPKGTFKRLDQLGFTPIVHASVKKMCREPHGLILVTGPTGSGKTTTLYSILNELNTSDSKILTAEDPPEIRMEGLTQVSINDKQGRSFPVLLRSFLRHDPDIILVGEIRDGETASLAIEAANTGHLVLSTLHTNDAVSAIKRLGRMKGVDTADFAFSLKGVLAQRLIKTFRQDVRELTSVALSTGVINPHDVLCGMMNKGLLSMGDVGVALNELMDEEYFPVGVRKCFTGVPEVFEGRTAITEFWKVGPKAADLIFDSRFNTFELAKVALEDDKMLPMAITGIEKVVLGISSTDEILKGVGIDAIRAHKKEIMSAYFKVDPI